MVVSLTPNKYGPFYVWDFPKNGKDYIVGADVAEGKAVTDDPQAGSSGRDWSAACVLERKSGDLVAGFLDQLPSNAYAEELYNIGTWYNEALVAVEVNSVGVSTVHTLNAASYPNMYMPPDRKIGAHDYLGLKLGWVTSRTTRPLLIDAIREALMAGFQIPWITLLEQLESMETDPRTGNPGAPYGMHDDIVMAYGIALCARQESLVDGQDRQRDYDSRLSPDTRKIFRLLAKEIANWEEEPENE